MTKKGKAKPMAKAHADFIKRWYQDVFEHGYKHGYEDGLKEAKPDGYCDEMCPICKTTMRCSFVLTEPGWAQVTCLACGAIFKELTNEI